MLQTIHRFIIKIFINVFLLSLTNNVHAGTGDTTVVRGFSNLLHQNCNVGDSMFLFPPDSVQHYRILLRYELSCPGFGCDIYDRIATLRVRQHTGQLDSTLTVAPSFRVDGNLLDSLQCMFSPSFQYSYDTVAMQMDSTPLPSLQVLFYADSLNPLQPTDTLQVWPAYYNQYVFNSNGVAIDSVFVTPDTVVYLTLDSIYSPFEVINTFEIARAITPYGQGVVLWFDVSDYSMLLHDSVHLESRVCGYSNGWFVSTDFYFIEGVPPIHPYKITNLWNGTFLYGSASDPIDNHLQPISLIVDSQSVYEKIRLVTTGHGFGGYPNQNVAEFYNVVHYLKINNINNQQRLWRNDCGRNPLYPQGAPGYTSTWFYKRANWCPGSFVTPHDYNATPLVGTNDSLIVDYNMVAYTVTGGPSGFYHPEYYIQSHAIFYDNIQYTNNAAIYDVRRPNGAFEYNRMNPACQAYSPEIIIKNYGSDTLQQLTIHYGIDGAFTGSFQWTGSLKFMDTVSVQLPPVSFGAGNHSFDIYLDQPNGMSDEFAYDDTLSVRFNATNIYNTNFVVVQIKTDNSPTQSSWKIKNDMGTVVMQRTVFTSPLATYTDTVPLPNGCYNITVQDVSGDGICCYNGYGYFKINAGGVTAPLFYSGDFGEYYSTNLTLDFQSSVSELLPDQFLIVFPNPANDQLILKTGFETGEVKLSLADMSGRVVLRPEVYNVIGYSVDLNISNLANGMYYLRMENQGKVLVKKVIVAKH